MSTSTRSTRSKSKPLKSGDVSVMNQLVEKYNSARSQVIKALHDTIPFPLLFVFLIVFSFTLGYQSQRLAKTLTAAPEEQNIREMTVQLLDAVAKRGKRVTSRTIEQGKNFARTWAIQAIETGKAYGSPVITATCVLLYTHAKYTLSSLTKEMYNLGWNDASHEIKAQFSDVLESMYQQGYDEALRIYGKDVAAYRLLKAFGKV